MLYLRSFLPDVPYCFPDNLAFPSGCSAHAPLGILTQAEHAHLEEAAALPGATRARALAIVPRQKMKLWKCARKELCCGRMAASRHRRRSPFSPPGCR